MDKLTMPKHLNLRGGLRYSRSVRPMLGSGPRVVEFAIYPAIPAAGARALSATVPEEEARAPRTARAVRQAYRTMLAG